MIESFSTQTGDEALAVGIGTRCAHGRAQDINLSGHLGEVCVIRLVIVTDQIDRVLTLVLGEAAA